MKQMHSLTHYRNLLLARRMELYSDLRAKLEMLLGPGNAADEDLAPVFHDQFVALQINRLEFHQLQLVNSALERMNNGDYGVCADCGDAVAHKRLEAIPWAIRCVGCQERVSPAQYFATPVKLVA